MDPDPWRAAVTAAGDAWAELGPAPPRFALHADDCRRRGGAHPPHLADLYLAWAAGEGDPRALALVDERCLQRIDPALRGIDTTPAFLEEVRQTLRIALFVGATRIRGYLGRGPLLAWVRVAAVRTAITLKRRSRPGVSVDDVLAELVTPAGDPELRELERLYRADFARALREALAALGGRARVVLRLHFVERLPLARIGELYDVHESTVSRWVKRAGEDVMTTTQRLLQDRLGLSPRTVESLARALRGNLELSISRLLADDGGAP